MKPWPAKALAGGGRINAPAWAVDAERNALTQHGREVLHLAAGRASAADATEGGGVFLCPLAAAPGSYQEHLLGQVDGMVRFTSLYRFYPFWTRPAVGQQVQDVRPETLWLLARTAAGHFVLLLPLLGRTTRFAQRAQGRT